MDVVHAVIVEGMLVSFAFMAIAFANDLDRRWPTWGGD